MPDHVPKHPIRSSAAEYLAFAATTGNGAESMEMRYEDENIWLTQKMMAALCDVSAAAVNQHLKTIFEDGELNKEAVIRYFLITASAGKQYNTNHYNLQASSLWASKSTTTGRFSSASGPTVSSRTIRSRAGP